MEEIISDFKYGLRLLFKNPAFSTAVVVALALGIGANTAIFSVVRSVLIEPLPYGSPEDLVVVEDVAPGQPVTRVSAANYLDWQRQAQSFQGMAGYRSLDLNLYVEGQPRVVRVGTVSPSFFRVLGVQAAVGSTFEAAEDVPVSPEVVLSHGFWQRTFGADRSMIGGSINLDERQYRVTGVMPADFEFAEKVDLWTRGEHGVPVLPFPYEGDITQLRSASYFEAVARLREGVSREAAESEMESIAAALGEQYPDVNEGHSARVVPLRDKLVGDVQPALMVLTGAVILVLLIACANVSNLLLARAGARSLELSVRASMGASRGRLVRQMVSEGLVMALLGGLVGFLLAAFGVQLLVGLSPDDIPRLDQVRLDGVVIAFTLGVAVLTALLIGVFPAVQSTRWDLQSQLRGGSASLSANASRKRAQDGFLLAQVTITVMLLVGAGLLMRSFLELQRVEPGFEPAESLTTKISLNPQRYAAPEQKVQFFRQVLQEVESLPGVRSAAAAVHLPFSGSAFTFAFDIAGRPPAEPGSEPEAGYRVVTPGYFRTMGIPLQAGRDFGDWSSVEGRREVLINQTLARLHWQDASPLGGQISFGDVVDGEPLTYEVVGVVGDVRHAGLKQPPEPEIYMPYSSDPVPYMSLVVRAGSNAAGLVEPVRRAVLEVDPRQPIYQISSLETALDDSVADLQFTAALLGVFSLTALLLAMVGVYSVMSYTVTQSRREIGIRMAMGANRKDVVTMVVRRALIVALVGVGLGAIGAWLSSRVLASLLYEVGTADPLTFFGTAAIVVGSAVLGSLLPARRASKIAPYRVLREA